MLKKDEILTKIKGIGFPDPNQLVDEIHRLNNNLEEASPSLKKIASFLDGASAKDLTEQIRNICRLWQKE